MIGEGEGKLDCLLTQDIKGKIRQPPFYKSLIFSIIGKSFVRQKNTSVSPYTPSGTISTNKIFTDMNIEHRLQIFCFI